MMLQKTLYCELEYPYKSNPCFIIDKYENKIEKLELNNGINNLAVLQSGLSYKDSLGNKFLVYPCESTLSFEIAKKCFDFSNLNVYFLDYYCTFLKHHNNASDRDRELVQSFIECFNYKISPIGFIKIQKQLLGVENEA